MASRAALNRLQKEYARIVKEPSPDIEAHPRESNILEWHFVIKGPKDTPYHGGHYHGKLIFPPDYPYKPPSIMMLTPSGRFRTNMRICMSMSDFHPETWVPAWSVASILNGVLSFMLEETTTVGSMEATDQAGTHVSGWKSLIDRHSRVFVLKRPFGVSIMIAGGLYG